MDQYYNIPIYIDSFIEFIEEADGHEEVYREPLDIECELEADLDDLDKWKVDKIKFLENITVKLIKSSELEDEVPYVGTHILALHIKYFSVYREWTFVQSLKAKGLLEDYTKQDTFKYYYNPVEHLWNDGYYLRFWVKVTQKESNKSIRIPIYNSIPIPQPSIG